jgi:hypothetical protein
MPKSEDFLGAGVDPEVGDAKYNQAYGDWLSAVKFGGHYGTRSGE